MHYPCSRRWLLAAAVGLMALAGCGPYGLFEWNYVISAGGGHLGVLALAVPIDQGLEDPTLTDEQRDKLAVVIAARDYAGQVIGLNVGDNYQTFVNLHGEPLAWNLSASPKDAIEAYMWDLPIVGTISYLGFFTLDEATAERDRLVAEQYDTLIYEVDAYSTLGILPDPVTTALLKRPVYGLADTIFHELTHATVYSGRNTVFDESVAVFVARTATRAFLDDRYGPDSDMVREARDNYEDTDRFNAFLADLRRQLEQLYSSDLSREEKIAAREPIFDAARQRVGDELLPQMHHPELYEQYTEFNFNNAFILVNARYNTDLDLFAAVYEQAGRDWSRTLDRLRQAAASADPFAFLQQHLAE